VIPAARSTESRPILRTYLGTFLIAFATLALEIATTRLLSVVTWYHLAFFAISAAMLGMTAAATHVYLKPDAYAPRDLDLRLQQACLGFALSIPLSLVTLCWVPVALVTPGTTLLGLVAVTLACALPFFFSGVAITVLLTRYPLPTARVYGADLVGAALGCLFVLGALEFVDVPTLMLVCGAVGGLAGVSFGARAVAARDQRLALLVVAVVAVGAVANSQTVDGIQPRIVKGARQDPGDFITMRWNSFSRIAVSGLAEGEPFYWGRSPNAPSMRARYHYLDIDGDAATPLGAFESDRDLAHLPFDITSAAYRLRPTGGAGIIGVGGGRDLQTALLFGHERVTGIELNPIFVDLLEDGFLDFAGLGARDDVTLVVDDARSHLSRSTERFAVLQMSMIDTWAATGVGAFSLSENGLYTIEAWRIFLEHLDDDGVFTVSRFHNPSEVGETGRVVSLAVATLLDLGAARPDEHIALLTTDRLSTLIVGRSPLTQADVSTLRRLSDDLGFVPTILPGHAVEHSALRPLVAAKSMDQLEEAASASRLNVTPPTDERPYFFNMLRLRELSNFGGVLFDWDALPSGVVRGNLIATAVLVGLIASLLLTAIATIFVPLLLRSGIAASATNPGVFWSGAAYFSLIGAGFMLVEIGLIQRLSVFLGHPVYALGILLFSIILSAGLGSLLSERLPLTRRPWLSVYPVVTVVSIVSFAVAFPPLARAMVASPLSFKIAASVGMVFPIGLLLGFFFPTGMRLLEESAGADTPWYWALNGVFGILFSAIAVFNGIYFGISSNLYLAAGLYSVTTIALLRVASPDA